jgi:hypothetical protein
MSKCNGLLGAGVLGIENEDMRAIDRASGIVLWWFGGLLPIRHCWFAEFPILRESKKLLVLETQYRENILRRKVELTVMISTCVWLRRPNCSRIALDQSSVTDSTTEHSRLYLTGWGILRTPR